MLKYEERKKLIGERIKREREHLKLSKKELLSRIFMSENSHKAVTAWEKGERLPDLDSLARMAEVFGCDVGYLLGDYDEHNHIAADVCYETGLSEDAVYFLRELAGVPSGKANGETPFQRQEKVQSFLYKDVMSAINALLSESHFEQCLRFWVNINDFLSAGDEPFRALLTNGEREYPAADVLAIGILEGNKQILRELRKERLSNG